MLANVGDEQHLLAPLNGGLRFCACAYEDRDGLLAELRSHVPESRFIPPDDVSRAVDELMFAQLEQPEAHTLAAVEAKDDRLLLRMQEADEWSVSDISPSGAMLGRV